MLKVYRAFSNQTKGVLLIVLANTFFAINMPVSRQLTPNWIDPFGLSQLRITFGFLSFLLLSFFVKEGQKFTKKEHITLFICGILGTSINQLFFLLGLSKTSPIDASLIVTTTPILTMIFSSIAFKEAFSIKRISGVFVGLAGAALILYTSQNPNIIQTGTLKGNLIILISGFSYALYLVVVKPIMKKHSPIHIMKWIFFYGSITALPFCYKYLKIAPEATYIQYAELAYALFFGTFLAYALVSFALQILRPTTVSMFNYIQPVLASVIAILIGQDTFNWTKPISATLIFIGVYLVITTKSKEVQDKF